MSESDVLKILEKCDEPMTAREMKQKLKIARGNVNKALQRLRERGEIKFVFKKYKDTYQKMYHYHV